jgi:hypothetical protein
MNNTPPAVEPTPPPVSAEDEIRLKNHFRSQQNLLVVIGAGGVAALVSAVLWAVITVATEYQIGWMAVGVGLAVGFAMRLGKGIDPIYRIVGAILALLGCIGGNAFSVIGFLASSENMGVFEVLPLVDLSVLPSIMMEMASPMDALFYGIAIYEGYQLSVRQITEQDLAAAKQVI